MREKENDMLSDLIKSVLVLVVAYLVKLGLAAINVVVDEGTFNAIVAGIVTLLLALFGHALLVRSNPSLVERGLLKE